MDINVFLSTVNEKSNVEIILGADITEKHIIEHTETKSDTTHIICIDPNSNPGYNRVNGINLYTFVCSVGDDCFIELLNHFIQNKINLKKIIVDWAVARFLDDVEMNFEDGRTMKKIIDFVKNGTEFYCIPQIGGIGDYFGKYMEYKMNAFMKPGSGHNIRLNFPREDLSESMEAAVARIKASLYKNLKEYAETHIGDGSVIF